MDSFTSLCDPAKVYLVLSAFTLIGLIFGMQYGPALAKLIFAVIFTFFLNWLCTKGYPGVSWFLVLVPFIGIGIALVFILFFLGSQGAKQSYTLAQRPSVLVQQNPNQQNPNQQNASQINMRQ